ncbi:HAMP domain-containing sensor histidine kinase [Virgibacillus salexigens]|uniref:histidine kinase n=1 Tax=Virgibacillus kapii TaxID=1638645 RepID=A0ABQ2DSD4_9BACI|nr:HAMP domain-containing sensor histidine kinase [Virgibacillus kapii]GGJ71440.1 two-component sensor histidine kinase [Virgibacillus kapii]
MFNKLSLKVGILFFFVIVIIEGFLYFVLYINLANERIDEVIGNLLARGNTHREVLEDNFTQTTLEHVGLMESASDFVVVITDPAGEVIVNSDPIDPEMTELIHSINYDKIPTEGIVIEDRWKDEPFIATDSPINISGEHRGHVFMFASTNQVKKILNHLSDQFTLIGLITIGLTIITIFLLTRFITRPLLNMKHATEQLSKGNHQVVLHTERNDELGELAKSITSLSNDLDRMKKERNEFLASISHELRTPLTYVKGYADIVQRQDLKASDREAYLEIIREETTRLSMLIKHLFELAKMDQHTFTIHREKVPFHLILKPIVDLINPVLTKEKLTLAIACPESIEGIVDPNRFQQVLLNILDNAIKHTHEHGHISLEVKQQKDRLDISISDNGEGIPEKELPYIFDRLYRVEKSRSRKSGGSGLGLTIAREIVEAHGGTIDAFSKKGAGTRVIIKLPRSEVDE